jgi:hypothetical protein
MPSVYEDLEKAMDDAGAELVQALGTGVSDGYILFRARGYAIARAKFDGACAILHEMEKDDDTITVTATTPPMYVKDYYPRGHRHVWCYPLDDGMEEDDDCKVVD